jgi:uncharacterized protein (TIGR03067 family)
MRAYLTLGFVLVGLVLPTAARGDDLAKEKEKLQGTWVGVSGERRGDPYLEESIKRLTVTIVDDKITFKWAREVPFTFTIDPTKERKTMDMTGLEGFNKGRVSLGIYACEDDLLLLCVNSSGTEERPKAFTTSRTSATGFSMYLLKRVKP